MDNVGIVIFMCLGVWRIYVLGCNIKKDKARTGRTLGFAKGILSSILDQGGKLELVLHGFFGYGVVYKQESN